MKRLLLFYAAFSSFLYANITLEKHEQWWEFECIKKSQYEQFAKWIGDEKEISRILAREHIVAHNYQSILDVPCGLCVDFDVLKKNNPQLNYQGMDITSSFVVRAKNLNIPVLQGKIQKIPFPDSSFDIAYSRHILEHLDSYQEAIKELVRVAKKEVLVVFFIIPTNNVDDRIVSPVIDGYPIYHNHYSKTKIESFLLTLSKVKRFTWQTVANTTECILHIMV